MKELEHKYKWSVISPHINDYPHLWFCTHANLEHIRHDYKPGEFEFIVVDNGSRDEVLRLVRRLMGTRNRLGKEQPIPGLPKKYPRKFIEIPHQLHSKPAMNIAAYLAEGEYLAFFDSHAFGDRDFFKTAADFLDDNPNVAVLHSPISWSGWHTSPNVRGHQYKLKLEDRFWGAWRAHRKSENPYPIGASGNTGMVIRRDAYYHMKGFPSMLRQYGGGEPYIDILTWMFGYEVYVHPQMHCYHFALARSRDYARSWMTFFRNVCLSAYICGGEKYSKPLLNNALEDHPDRKIKYIMLYNEALKFGRLRRKFVKENAKYTLDEVQELWKEQNIFH